MNQDITDFLDPNDGQYNASLNDRVTILDRSVYTQDMFAPCSVQNASAVDRVDGVRTQTAFIKIFTNFFNKYHITFI